MRILSSESYGDYTPQERASFFLHVSLALASVPLNFINGYAGLIIFPYLLFLTLKPRSQYLLPIIIILAYSSPLQLVFCFGCFFYVLFHMNQLRRYGLVRVWGLYLCISPFFIWYFYQKTQLAQRLLGVGDLASGFGTYFMFASAFWAVLSIRRVGITFVKGLLCWSLFLVMFVSILGTEHEPLNEMENTARIFCRQVFWAIPFCAATFCFFILERRRKFAWLGFGAGLGCFVLFLDIVGILRYKLSFTSMGLMLMSSFFVFLAMRMKKLCMRLSPLLFFALSCAFVFYSSQLVKKYRGIGDEYGNYDEMKVTNVNTLWIKLQRKMINDRASVWAFNLESIKDQMRRNPIFLEVKPYAEAYVNMDGNGFVYRQMLMDAHNTMLYLLRHFGLYGGLGLYILFVWYFCRRENRKIMIENSDRHFILVLSVCLAQGIIGGHTGHYPVTLPFGPVLFALLGSCWRVGYESRLMGRRI